MKISEIALQTIKDSVGISDEYSDTLIGIYKDSALAFIKGYTGLTAEEIDTHDDLTIAFLCLIGDMFENRSMTVEKDKLNPTVSQILAMYAVNYV